MALAARQVDFVKIKTISWGPEMLIENEDFLNTWWLPFKDKKSLNV